jgi:hypothetical protein
MPTKTAEAVGALLENMRDLLALLYTLGFFCALGIAMFHGIPNEGGEVLKVLMTIMATAQISVVQYYFGGAKSQTNGGSTNVTAIDSTVSAPSPQRTP